MAVYVVQKEDNIASISKKFDISSDTIVAANFLKNPSALAIGQALIIPERGCKLITVKSSDTLESISREYNISVQSIKSVNPSIAYKNELFPGQLIIIPGIKTKHGTIEVNGFVFKNTTEKSILPLLPSLTYLSIFSYRVRSNGNLIRINDSKLIDLSLKNNVAPIMVVSENEVSNNIATIIKNETSRNALIFNIASIIKEKNYYGVNLCFKNLSHTKFPEYYLFISELRDKLGKEPIIIDTVMHGNEVKLVDSNELKVTSSIKSNIANRTIFRTFRNNFLDNPPSALSPLGAVAKTISTALETFKSSKIMIGLANYACDWVLPFKSGNSPKLFSNSEAVRIAYKNKSIIQFDTTSKSPFFNYYDSEHKQHIVWFENVKSMENKLSLISRYNLCGVSLIFTEKEFDQNLMLLNSMFEIKKVDLHT